MTASARTRMIVITLVTVVAVIAAAGVSLAVWIGGDGEGASFDLEVIGWYDPSVRYLRYTATGAGGEELSIVYDDAEECFVATTTDGSRYDGALIDGGVTAVGYYGIIEELLIPSAIVVRSETGTAFEGGYATQIDVVAVDMPNIQQEGGEALGLVTELTVGANVADISAHSFSYMNALTKVTFVPSSTAVTLGDYCFARCANIAEIVEDGRTVTRGTGCFE